LDKPLHVIYKVSKLAYRIRVILIANERVKKIYINIYIYMCIYKYIYMCIYKYIYIYIRCRGKVFVEQLPRKYLFTMPGIRESWLLNNE
jgi:hypothetical protein